MNASSESIPRIRQAERTRFLLRALSVLAVGIAALSAGSQNNSLAAGPIATPATAPATRPSFKHPAADAALRFQAAIVRGDAQAAGQATADTARPLADQPNRISQLIAFQKTRKAAFISYDVQADGDLAAVIVGPPARVGDKIFESEIWFLVRQAGEWRVLPEYDSYERSEYGFTAKTIETFKKLEERAETRTTQLRKEITGCDC